MTVAAIRGGMQARQITRRLRPGRLTVGARNVRRAVREYGRALDLGRDVSPDVRAKAIQERAGAIARRAAGLFALSVTAADLGGVAWGTDNGAWVGMLTFGLALTAAVVWSGMKARWLLWLTGPAALAVFTAACYTIAPGQVAWSWSIAVAVWLVGGFAVLWHFAADDGSLLDNIGLPNVSTAPSNALAVIASARALGIDVQKYPERTDALAIISPASPHPDGGWKASVRLPLGRTAAEVKRDIVASVCGVIPRMVEATPHPGNVSIVDLVVHGVDPESLPSARPPLLDAPRRTSVFEPARIGQDSGGPVEVAVIGNSILAGGMPGGGKSVVALNFLSHALLDPSCEVYIADGKVLDTAPLAEIATAWTGDDLSATAAMLETVEARMSANKTRISALGLGNKSSREAVERGVRPVVVFVDELNSFLDVRGPDARYAERIKRSLKRIAEQGRAVGVVPVLATQNPCAENTPPDLRDIIRTRVAMKTAKASASNAVLGDGAHGMGWSSHDIEGEGNGILRDHRGRFRRIRADFFDADSGDMARLVSAAKRIRAQAAADAPVSVPDAGGVTEGPVAALVAAMDARGADRISADDAAEVLGVARDDLRSVVGVPVKPVRVDGAVTRGYRITDLGRPGAVTGSVTGPARDAHNVVTFPRRGTA